MSLLILLVEDNLDLSETVIQYLELEDMLCDFASSAESGLELVKRHNYDVIVLDIMLPRMTGLDFCKTIRESGSDTPVLMLTARDTLADKIEGFESGTDDYLVKPFDLPELALRIQSLSKRRSGQARVLAKFDLSMNLDTKELTRGGRNIVTSPIGWKILEALMRSSPAIVSRERLIQSVWGDESPESDSLKVHVHKLRKQIDGGGEMPLLVTVAGQGYALRESPAKGIGGEEE